MKRILCVVLGLCLLMLCGCTKPCRWEKREVNGKIAVLTAQTEGENGEWYCTVDTETRMLLSVAVIYPGSFGAFDRASATADGQKTDLTKTVGERDEGGVLFYTFSAEDSALGRSQKMVITQPFAAKTVSLCFTTADIEKVLFQEE